MTPYEPLQKSSGSDALSHVNSQDINRQRTCGELSPGGKLYNYFGAKSPNIRRRRKVAPGLRDLDPPRRG